MLLNTELRGDKHNLLLMVVQVGFSTAVVLSPFGKKKMGKWIYIIYLQSIISFLTKMILSSLLLLASDQKLNK